MDVKSSADMGVNLDGKPKLWRIGRTASYFLERSAAGWKIDGFRGSWQDLGWFPAT